MKKIVLVAAAAGLMTLAACTPSASDNTTANDVDTMGNSIDDTMNMGDDMMSNDAMGNDTMGNDAMMDSNSAM